MERPEVQLLLRTAEAAARPAVLRGLVAGWPAVGLWAGSAGLQHMRQRAGDAGVQAMYSSTGGHFFGNIEAHQPVTCTLNELLDVAAAPATADNNSRSPSKPSAASASKCSERSSMGACSPYGTATPNFGTAVTTADASARDCCCLGQGAHVGHCGIPTALMAKEPHATNGAAAETAEAVETAAAAGTAAAETTAAAGKAAAGTAAAGTAAAGAAAAEEATAAGPHLYLAQQSLSEPGLAALLQDITTPEVLRGRRIDHTNMWLSVRQTRSSIHYDPYHNLLCVVRGCKRIRLYSPEASPGLYPRPVCGDSSNHSSVDFAAPDAQRHPLYRWAEAQALHVSLEAGDALFVPEGWWHQVDSTDLTIAINYWWRSEASAQLLAQPHLHHYFLRQLLASVTAQASEQLQQAMQTLQQPQVVHMGQAAAAHYSLHHHIGHHPGQAAAAHCNLQALQTLQTLQSLQTGQAAAAHLEREGTTGLAAAAVTGHAAEAAAQAQVQSAAVATPHGAARSAIMDGDCSDLHRACKRPRTEVPDAVHVSHQQPQQQPQSLQHSPPEQQHDQHAANTAGLEQSEQLALVQLLQHLAPSDHKHAQEQGLPGNADAPSRLQAAHRPHDQQQRAGTLHGRPAVCSLSSPAAIALAPSSSSGMLCSSAWQAHQRHCQQQLELESLAQHQELGPHAAAAATAAAPSASPTATPSTAQTPAAGPAAMSAPTPAAHAANAPHITPAVLAPAARAAATKCDPLGLGSPITRIFAGLPAQELCNVLFAMARKHPDALRTLMLQRLPPAAAQLLTGKLEEADAAAAAAVAPEQPPLQAVDASGMAPGMAASAAIGANGVDADSAAAGHVAGDAGDNAGANRATGPSTDAAAGPGSRDEFYAALWGAVGQPEAAMQVLLEGRAAVAQAVFRAVTRHLLVGGG